MNSLKSIITLPNALLFFSLIAAWPCVFYLMGILPHFKINLIFLLVSLGMYVTLTKSFNITLDLGLIVFAQFFTWLLYSFIFSDSSYFTRLLYITIALLVVMADSKNCSRNLIKIFVYWVTLQAVLSFVGFCLCITDIIQPLSTFEEMDGREGYNFGLFTTNTYMGIFVRPAGFFDEPGALACWGVYSLILNRLFLKKKYVEYALLIGLTVTLSIAFYIQAFLYFLLFYRENIRKLILVLSLAALSIGILVSQDEVFYDAIIGRLQYDETEGTISGDNRAELTKNARAIFLSSPIVGVGARNLVENYEGVDSNVFTYFACDGIIGQIVTWLPFVYIFFILGRGRPEVRSGVIVLAVGLLQRPFDFTQLMFPLILYNMIAGLIANNQLVEDEVDGEEFNDYNLEYIDEE